VEFRTDDRASLKIAEVHWQFPWARRDDGKTHVNVGVAVSIDDHAITIAFGVGPDGKTMFPFVIVREHIESAYWVSDDGTPVVWPDGKLAREVDDVLA